MPDIKITVLRTLDSIEVFGKKSLFKEPAATCTYF